MGKSAIVPDANAPVQVHVEHELTWPLANGDVDDVPTVIYHPQMGHLKSGRLAEGEQGEEEVP